MTGREEHIPDEPAAWEELVASFHESVEIAEPPWPAAENIDETDKEARPENGARSGRTLPRTSEFEHREPERAEATTTGRQDDGWVFEPVYFGAAELDLASDDEHFVPPPPPPLPELDAVQKAGWVCLLGGPLYLILSFALDWDVPGWTTALAAMAGAGGFVTLIARMKDRDDDDPHSGAVV
jgi:hypothetical protein